MRIGFEISATAFFSPQLLRNPDMRFLFCFYLRFVVSVCVSERMVLVLTRVSIE